VKKPCGYLLTADGKLVVAIPHDGEECSVTLARLADQYKVGPEAFVPQLPKPASGEYASIEIAMDRHLPPKGYKAKPWVGQGAAAAADGAKAYYQPPAAPMSNQPSPGPTTPKLPVVPDYSTLITPRPE
jgi:hypothetical protein